MSRAALVCAAALVVCAAPVAGAQARCETTQVESLTVSVPQAPAALAPGQVLTMRVEVVRAAGTPVETAALDVEVLLGLTGARWGVYDSGVTDAGGEVVLQVTVPRGVRGVTELDVEAFRTALALPCLRVEEHGRVRQAWAPVR